MSGEELSGRAFTPPVDGVSTGNVLKGTVKLIGTSQKWGPTAFAYAVCRRAISFHICIASVLSSR
ncbi:hypothetical protein JOH51_001413 [Rhizobium leguminosarum]|nr:hypothetical protein [Rhizobium leguminosarum]